MNLRDRSKLAEALRLTLGCMPGVMVGLGSGSGTEALPKLPGAFAISRSQIQIGAAFCCFWKEKFESFSTNCAVYMWADSSPQGSVDWLLSMMRVIEEKDLVAFAQAAEFLVKSAKDWHERVFMQEQEGCGRGISRSSAASKLEIVQERHAAGLFLTEKNIIHRQIPMALGSGGGAANLDQKLLYFACARSSWQQSLAKPIMHSVCAFCTDLGTESGFTAQEEGFRFADLLPNWMADAGLESEENFAFERRS